MNLDLPVPVARYFAAELDKNWDTLSTYFAVDALVHDESHNYRGLDAIRAWKVEAQDKYQYVVEPLAATVRGEIAKIRARLAGTFPGSPVEVEYIFTLADGKIQSLEIR